MRLPGFDYTRPYFYMVTLKRNAGFPALSRISDDPAAHWLDPNEITFLFSDIIKTFHETWRCIEPIECFSIMPDHIHLLIKIRDIEKRVSLGVIVRMLARALEKAFFATRAGEAARGSTLTERVGGAASGFAASGGDGVCKSGFASGAAAGERAFGGAAVGKSAAAGCSASPHLFAFDWHDWIVKVDGQLAAFTRYIRENPKRAALRRANARYFQRVGKISFLGRDWFGYGNAALLELPVLEPFKGHRATREGSEEWNALVARAARIGPGGAGVSTFMSPLEKACGNAIAKAGGAWIVLSPEGFSPRWHPPRQKEKFCAEGRMLFLSLYEEHAKQPTNAELYSRCHEMVDLVNEKLSTRKEN
jgi:hypothetical protein